MLFPNSQPPLSSPDSGAPSLELLSACVKAETDLHTRNITGILTDSYLSVRAFAQEFAGFLKEDTHLLPEREQHMAEVLNYYCTEVDRCTLAARASMRATSEDLRQRGLIIESVNLASLASGFGQIDHAFTLLVNAEAKRWLYEQPKPALAHYRLAERILSSHFSEDQPLLCEVREEMNSCGAIREKRELLHESNLSRLLW